MSVFTGSVQRLIEVLQVQNVQYCLLLIANNLIYSYKLLNSAKQKSVPDNENT